jgi:hypothetical protein
LNALIFMKDSQHRQIWEKTRGHCHFCGESVEFEKRGWRDGDLTGYWEIDHIVQRGKGGNDSVDNYLPAYTRCNRLRWHRTGEKIRELLLLGLVAQEEVKKGTIVGESLVKLTENCLLNNKKRRIFHKYFGGLPCQKRPTPAPAGSSCIYLLSIGMTSQPVIIHWATYPVCLSNVIRSLSEIPS